MRVKANTGGLRVGLEGQGLRAKQVPCRQQQAGCVAHDTPDEQVWLTHPESEDPEGKKVSPWQTERRHEDHTLSFFLPVTYGKVLHLTPSFTESLLTFILQTCLPNFSSQSS